MQGAAGNRQVQVAWPFRWGFDASCVFFLLGKELRDLDEMEVGSIRPGAAVMVGSARGGSRWCKCGPATGRRVGRDCGIFAWKPTWKFRSREGWWLGVSCYLGSLQRHLLFLHGVDGLPRENGEGGSVKIWTDGPRNVSK